MRALRSVCVDCMQECAQGRGSKLVPLLLLTTYHSLLTTYHLLRTAYRLLTPPSSTCSALEQSNCSVSGGVEPST